MKNYGKQCKFVWEQDKNTWIDVEKPMKVLLFKILVRQLSVLGFIHICQVIGTNIIVLEHTMTDARAYIFKLPAFYCFLVNIFMRSIFRLFKYQAIQFLMISSLA